jgi:hypothetical protein
MKYGFVFMPAFLAVLFGCLLLLPLLASASLQDPRLSGLDYGVAVLTTLFTKRMVGAMSAGLMTIIVGLAMFLYAFLLLGLTRQERREARPVFWMALGVGIIAIVILLMMVNLAGLKAGKVISISQWTCRGKLAQD